MEDEFGIDQKEFYRKTLHSKLLCDNRMCDICKKGETCHKYIDGYDTVGNPLIKIKCFCGTTACLKVM